MRGEVGVSRLDLVTEALEGLKATEHLDEDWAVPCERMARANVSYDQGKTWQPGADHCGGQNPAEWVLYAACGCVPTVVLYCTPCRDLVLGYPRVACGTCRQVWSPASGSVRLIEPLSRRTT